MSQMRIASSNSEACKQPMCAVLGLRKLRLTGRPAPFRQVTDRKEQRQVCVKASGGTEDINFDSILSDIADKFEKSDNKAAIIGYSFAAIFALWFSEWFIHLPVLGFLLGGPIQLLGLVLLPYFGVKYLVDNESLTGDASRAVDRVVKKLPGLDK